MNTAQRVNGPSVRAIRQLKGIGQTQLARAGGIKQPYMSLIESGVRYPAKPELAKSLANALGVHITAITFPALSEYSEEPAA